MPGNLLVELNPQTPRIEDGRGAVDLTIVVQNQGDVLDQYQVEISGLDTAWYRQPPDISLFPSERGEFKLNVRPNGSRISRGNYPFTVKVRSHSGTVEESANGVLEVGGLGQLQLSFEHDEQTGHRQGTYTLRLSNDGSADVQAALEATDAEAACTIRFTRGNQVLVPASGRAEVQLQVRPRKRPWIGPDRTYKFSVTARALSGGAEPKSAPGAFTHRPWLRSWGPIKLIAFTLVGAAVLLVVAALLYSAGVPQQFPRRAAIGFNVARGSLCRIPALTSRCPIDAFAALPEREARCAYDGPFKDYADAEAALIGPCISSVSYDEFGNGLQYSENGVLFWQKDANTVYFFTGVDVYAFLQNKSQHLR